MEKCSHEPSLQAGSITHFCEAIEMIRQSILYKELCQCCHPGHNDRRYTKVSQSWLDAICGSISCARPIHGQCRKQKHANSIQSLQNCHHPGQWPSVRNGRNLQQLPVAMRGSPLGRYTANCPCLGDHVFFTITSMPRGASMVTRLGSEPRGNSSVQSHK